MGVDAYLLADNGRHMWVGRAHNMAAPAPAFDDDHDRLCSQRGLPAQDLEDYGLAMVRDGVGDGWLARDVVLFARANSKGDVTLIRDDAPGFETLYASGTFSAGKAFESTREENLAVSGICPRCRRKDGEGKNV